MSDNVQEGRLERGIVATFGNAPWWLISAGLHLVILLGAALIYIEHAIAREDKHPIIVVPRTGGPLLNRFEPEPLRNHPHGEELIIEEASAAAGDDTSLFDPYAPVGDKNRSDDGEPFDELKGDSTKFISRLPGKAGGLKSGAGPNPGLSGIVGPGGGDGGGGRKGGPVGSKFRSRVVRPIG